MQSTSKVAGATEAAEADEGVYTVDSTKVEKKLEAAREARQRLESRDPQGDPLASVMDPQDSNRVIPRYKIVQNRSNKVVIISDLKSGPEDPGLMLQPEQIEVLTDYYSPQQINRSRGLKYAATKLEGLKIKDIRGNVTVISEFALVPLRTVEEGEEFHLPPKVQLPKGVEIEDTVPNDFDLRFEEEEAKEAKRNEKLFKKTLGLKVSKQHGGSPTHV